MADELLNLVEYAKGSSDPIESALIEQFATSSDVLEIMPFKTVAQGRNVFSREKKLPTVAFRAINSEPEISHGGEEEFQDMCYPISGLLEFDRVKLRRYGERKRMTYLKGQMKKGAAVWTDTFINGDNESDPKEFDGLKARLLADTTGSVDGTVDLSRLLANATGSGGGALSLTNMDKAEALVNQGTHWLMSRSMKTKFKTAARSSTLSNGRITDDMDSDLGRRVTRFGDLPILTGYEVGLDDTFLPFNEVAYGGGSAVTTSIYLVSFREDGLVGIQTAPPEMVDIGNTDRGVHERDLFEWDVGISIEDYFSALRISSITDAAIVA